MAFDGLTARAVASELRNLLIGSRVDKIHQPDLCTLVITFRNLGQHARVLISIDPRSSRIQLTRLAKDNPLEPPVFCMVLRKHLVDGKVVDVLQPGLERIIEVHVETLEEGGVFVVKRLIAEIMGRHSNVVLVGPDGRTIDAMKRVSGEVNRYRELVPGEPYVPPPPHPKANPIGMDQESIARTLVSFVDEDGRQPPLEKALVQCFEGIGPVIAGEVLHRSGIDERERGLAPVSAGMSAVNAVARSLKDVVAQASEGPGRPCLAVDRETGAPREYSCVELTHLTGTELKLLSSMGDAMDAFYGPRDEAARLGELRATLTRAVSSNLDRARRKAKKQEAELSDAENAEEFKRIGELITANLHVLASLPAGQSSIRVVDYYDPELKEIEVEIDPTLTPTANAKRYFKKYSKAKNALEATARQLKLTREEIDYLEQVLLTTEQSSTVDELEDVRDELTEVGYLKKARRPSRRRPSKPEPMRFRSVDGLEILVGKNNRQNDFLTMKLARGGDIWFHVKNAPGAHVVLRTRPSEEVPATSLEAAALLAARYSKAAQSANVEVDYTARKNVWKPAGAKPGMVLYENYRTAVVTPSPENLRARLDPESAARAGA